MPKVGDRIVVEGSKVGGGRREGTLTGVVGSLIKVKWADGGETLMAPGAGAIQVLPGKGTPSTKQGVKKTPPAKKPAKKAAAKGKS